jgi:hypothetical protein
VVAAAAAVVAGKARYAVALLCLATGAAAAVPVTTWSLAGRYTDRFDNGNVDGEHYVSTDEVVIVPTHRSHAIFDIHTNFFNGHECSIGGLAVLEGDALVYRDPDSRGYEGRPCEIRIRRQGNRLTWDDRGSCSSYCGMRGRLSDGAIAWSSRRPLTRSQRARILRDYQRNRTTR